jgi:hypothetical protein
LHAEDDSHGRDQARTAAPGAAALKAEIDKGLADFAEGRVQDFGPDRIIERGRTLLASRFPSA